MDGNPDDPTLTTFEGVLNIFDLEVFNGISPDGDNVNDFFIIEGIDAFPDNSVQIFNNDGVYKFLNKTVIQIVQLLVLKVSQKVEQL